jgi:hypothetical protein
MYSDNPLHFDGMCVIFIGVGFGETCAEDSQCLHLGEAQCFPSSCQCRENFNFNGLRCAGNLGMYKVYISNIIYIGMYKVYVSNIIYNAIFSARIIILA